MTELRKALAYIDAREEAMAHIFTALKELQPLAHTNPDDFGEYQGPIIRKEAEDLKVFIEDLYKALHRMNG